VAHHLRADRHTLPVCMSVDSGIGGTMEKYEAVLLAPSAGDEGEVWMGIVVWY
jgi:hypothetical protein